jgi:hypothetical protein
MNRSKIYYIDKNLNIKYTICETTNRLGLDSILFHLGQNVKVIKIEEERLEIVETKDVSSQYEDLITRWDFKFIRIQTNNEVLFFKDENKALEKFKMLNDALITNYKLNYYNEEFWNYTNYYFEEKDAIEEYERLKKHITNVKM